MYNRSPLLSNQDSFDLAVSVLAVEEPTAMSLEKIQAERLLNK